jgi:hypothetical protein
LVVVEFAILVVEGGWEGGGVEAGADDGSVGGARW